MFALVDKDGDGRLNSPESLELARLCGSDISRHMWAEEYALLCNFLECDLAVGLGFAAFLALMQVTSGDGAHQGTEEFCEIFNALAGN
eukprot:14248580-Alexandrium_andersonii.AAC.1